MASDVIARDYLKGALAYYADACKSEKEVAAAVIHDLVGFMMRRYPEEGRFARILAELHGPIVDALRYWNKELGGPG